MVYPGKLIEGLKQTRRNGKLRKHTVGMAEIVEHILREHRTVTLYNQPGDFVFSKADGSPLDPGYIRKRVI